MMGKRIGLFGGSFNPIHNGHVTLGKTMLNAMHLDEVWYMVSPQNPWKQNVDLLPEQQRLQMVKAAVDDVEGLRASDYEFHLPRPSYTWNTLQHLKGDYPDAEFILIIGGDNWEHFDKWAHYEEILAQHEIAVFPREGADMTRLQVPENVTIVQVPLVNVTSTMLREMVREEKSIDAYVPKAVAEMISRQRWYQK